MAAALPPRWNDALRRIEEMSDPSLEGVRLSFVNSNNAYPNLYSGDHKVVFYFSNNTPAAFFARLGDAVGNNTQLCGIDFNGFDFENAVPAMAENSYFLDGLKRNSSIRTLQLSRLDLSNGAICGMLRSLGESSSNLVSSLTTVMTWKVFSGNDDGISAFKAMIRRCTNISTLKFCRCTDDSIRFHEIMEAVGDPRKITRIDTPPIGRAGVEALVPILEDTGSVLNHLELNISDTDVDCDRVAALLAGKTTLEQLDVRIPSLNDRVRFGRSFSQALCATISGTYFSKLRQFNFFGTTLIDVPYSPEDVSSILEVNQRFNDKKKGGMLKVILFHPTAFNMTPFVEWGLKVLPIVVNRLESVRSIEYLPGEMIDNRKLVTIYQSIRAMPEVFEPIVGGKRKRSGGS